MCLEASRNHFAINYFQTYAGFQLQGRNLKHTMAASDLPGGHVATLTSLAFMCQDNSSPEPLVCTLKQVELFTLRRGHLFQVCFSSVVLQSHQRDSDASRCSSLCLHAGVVNEPLKVFMFIWWLHIGPQSWLSPQLT